jgi:hypothetical protein
LSTYNNSKINIMKLPVTKYVNLCAKFANKNKYIILIVLIVIIIFAVYIYKYHGNPLAYLSKQLTIEPFNNNFVYYYDHMPVGGADAGIPGFEIKPSISQAIASTKNRHYYFGKKDDNSGSKTHTMTFPLNNGDKIHLFDFKMDRKRNGQPTSKAGAGYYSNWGFTDFGKEPNQMVFNTKGPMLFFVSGNAQYETAKKDIDFTTKKISLILRPVNSQGYEPSYDYHGNVSDEKGIGDSFYKGLLGNVSNLSLKHPNNGFQHIVSDVHRPKCSGDELFIGDLFPTGIATNGLNKNFSKVIAKGWYQLDAGIPWIAPSNFGKLYGAWINPNGVIEIQRFAKDTDNNYIGALISPPYIKMAKFRSNGNRVNNSGKYLNKGSSYTIDQLSGPDELISLYHSGNNAYNGYKFKKKSAFVDLSQTASGASAQLTNNMLARPESTGHELIATIPLVFSALQELSKTRMTVSGTGTETDPFTIQTVGNHSHGWYTGNIDCKIEYKITENATLHWNVSYQTERNWDYVRVKTKRPGKSWITRTSDSGTKTKSGTINLPANSKIQIWYDKDYIISSGSDSLTAQLYVTGASSDSSQENLAWIWKPNAPSGYSSIGYVATTSSTQPSMASGNLSYFRCVKTSALDTAEFGGSLMPLINTNQFGNNFTLSDSNGIKMSCILGANETNNVSENSKDIIHSRFIGSSTPASFRDNKQYMQQTFYSKCATNDIVNFKLLIKTEDDETLFDDIIFNVPVAPRYKYDDQTESCQNSGVAKIQNKEKFCYDLVKNKKVDWRFCAQCDDNVSPTCNQGDSHTKAECKVPLGITGETQTCGRDSYVNYYLEIGNVPVTMTPVHGNETVDYSNYLDNKHGIVGMFDRTLKGLVNTPVTSPNGVGQFEYYSSYEIVVSNKATADTANNLRFLDGNIQISYIDTGNLNKTKRKANIKMRFNSDVGTSNATAGYTGELTTVYYICYGKHNPEEDKTLMLINADHVSEISGLNLNVNDNEFIQAVWDIERLTNENNIFEIYTRYGNSKKYLTAGSITTESQSTEEFYNYQPNINSRMRSEGFGDYVQGTYNPVKSNIPHSILTISDTSQKFFIAPKLFYKNISKYDSNMEKTPSLGQTSDSFQPIENGNDYDATFMNGDLLGRVMKLNPFVNRETNQTPLASKYIMTDDTHQTRQGLHYYPSGTSTLGFGRGQWSDKSFVHNVPVEGDGSGGIKLNDYQNNLNYTNVNSVRNSQVMFICTGYSASTD